MRKGVINERRPLPGDPAARIPSDPRPIHPARQRVTTLRSEQSRNQLEPYPIWCRLEYIDERCVVHAELMIERRQRGC